MAISLKNIRKNPILKKVQSFTDKMANKVLGTTPMLSPLPADQTMGTMPYYQRQKRELDQEQERLKKLLNNPEALVKDKLENENWVKIKEQDKIKIHPTPNPESDDYWDSTDGMKFKQFDDHDEYRRAVEFFKKARGEGQTPPPAPSPSPSPTPTPQLHKSVPFYLQDPLTEAAKKYKLPIVEFSNLLAQESMNFNPQVIRGEKLSPAGAIGVAQFMAPTAEWFAETQYEPFDPTIPEEAIPAAAAYLSYLKTQYNYPDWKTTYAAYNAGPGRVNKALQKYGTIDKALPYLPLETQRYVPTVLGTYVSE